MGRLWVLGLVCTGALLCADDMVLLDGTQIRAQIYKETSQAYFYINAATDECCQIAKKAVKSVQRAEKPVVDLRTYLDRRHAKLTPEQRDDLEAALLAQAKNPPKEAAKTAETKTGVKPDVKPDTKAKPMTYTGVTVKSAGGVPELTVDPFVDEGPAKPNTGIKEGASKK